MTQATIPHPINPELFSIAHPSLTFNIPFITPKYLIEDQLRKTTIQRFQTIRPGDYISFSRKLHYRNEPYWLHIEKGLNTKPPILLEPADIKRLFIDNPIFKASAPHHTRNTYPVHLDPNRFANHPNLEILAPSLRPAYYFQTLEPKGYFFYQDDTYKYSPYLPTLDYTHQFGVILKDKLRKSQADIAHGLKPGDHLTIQTNINPFSTLGYSHSLMYKNGKLFRTFDIKDIWQLFYHNPIFSATLF